MEEQEDILELESAPLSGADKAAAFINVKLPRVEAVGGDSEVEDDDLWSYLAPTLTEGHERLARYIACGLGLVGYNLFLAYAVYHHVVVEGATDLRWCDGVGLVILITATVYLCFAFGLIRKRLSRAEFASRLTSSASAAMEKTSVRVSGYALVATAIVVFLVLDTTEDRQRLVSAGGIVFFIIIGTLGSKHPRHINWRQVSWGMVLQFIIGLVVLRWEPGRSALECIGSKVNRFLSFTDEGSQFLFGYLVNQQPFITRRLDPAGLAYNVTMEINEAQAILPVIMFKSVSVLYFFSFMVGMLTHLGAIQWVTEKIGWLMQVTIRTTPCESMNAAANIFLGLAMAPLLIRPYISRLTRSEVHAVLVSGFSTIAGPVMAAYISFGVSAAHLITASVMSAPASLAYAKLIYPETQESRTTSGEIKLHREKLTDDRPMNLVDAATRGASGASSIVANITANIIAYIAFVNLFNYVCSFFFGLIGHDYITFEWLMGKMLIPLAFLMGVEWDDCEKVGQLVGLKIAVDDFLAYRKLSVFIARKQLSGRSITIATYALCGFSHPSALGVGLAVLSSMCPERKSDFARVILRAWIGGAIASLLTACIAGTLITA